MTLALCRAYVGHQGWKEANGLAMQDSNSEDTEIGIWQELPDRVMTPAAIEIPPPCRFRGINVILPLMRSCTSPTRSRVSIHHHLPTYCADPPQPHDEHPAPAQETQQGSPRRPSSTLSRAYTSSMHVNLGAPRAARWSGSWWG